jgi:hypothetical protein
MADSYHKAVVVDKEDIVDSFDTADLVVPDSVHIERQVDTSNVN